MDSFLMDNLLELKYSLLSTKYDFTEPFTFSNYSGGDDMGMPLSSSSDRQIGYHSKQPM
jgi:hypothetical protein